MGIPNMPEDVAIAIANSPMGDNTTPIRGTAGWLVTQGLVDIPQMVKLDRFVTGRGLVYRAQIVGFFAEGGGYTRLEAAIDASETPRRRPTSIAATALAALCAPSSARSHVKPSVRIRCPPSGRGVRSRILVSARSERP